MSEQNNQQAGSGKDNLGQAAKQMAKATKQVQGAMAKKAAAKGAQAAVSAAATTAKAGVAAGQAAATIAAGTAAGGPVGAIVSAAWSMRHTLFKILICICLVVVFLITTVISLPSIIFQHLMGFDDENSTASTVIEAVMDVSEAIVDVINFGYKLSVNSITDLIFKGGYDYEYSMNSLTDNANPSSGFDVYYIMAAYSVSMNQRDATKDNMIAKLTQYAGEMFSVTHIVKEAKRFIEDPLGYIEELFEFVECIIHPFNGNIILKAFNLNLDAKYGDFNITCGEAINDMAQALRLSMGKGG